MLFLAVSVPADIEKHGGALRLASAASDGTAVSFTIPGWHYPRLADRGVSFNARTR